MKKLPFLILFVLVAVTLCVCGAAGPAVQAAITNPPEIAQSYSAEPVSTLSDGAQITMCVSAGD